MREVSKRSRGSDGESTYFPFLLLFDLDFLCLGIFLEEEEEEEEEELVVDDLSVSLEVAVLVSSVFFLSSRTWPRIRREV
jgi:hypothetical protein